MGKVWDVLAPRNLELGPLAGHERAGSPWRNFILARDDDCIAWLALDKANASANTLSEDVLVAGKPPVAPGRARALGSGERTELEIARRENVPDFTHLAKSPFHHPRA